MIDNALVLRLVPRTGTLRGPLVVTADFGADHGRIVEILSKRLSEGSVSGPASKPSPTSIGRTSIGRTSIGGTSVGRTSVGRPGAGQASIAQDSAVQEPLRLTQEDLANSALARLKAEVLDPLMSVSERPVRIILGDAQGKTFPSITLQPTLDTVDLTLSRHKVASDPRAEPHPTVSLSDLAQLLQRPRESARATEQSIPVGRGIAIGWGGYQAMTRNEKSAVWRTGGAYVGVDHPLNNPNVPKEIRDSNGRTHYVTPDDKAMALKAHILNNASTRLDYLETLIAHADVPVLMNSRAEAAVLAGAAHAAAPLLPLVQEAVGRRFDLDDKVFASAMADINGLRGAALASHRRRLSRETNTDRAHLNEMTRGILSEARTRILSGWKELEGKGLVPSSRRAQRGEVVTERRDAPTQVSVGLSALIDLAQRAVAKDLKPSVLETGADPDRRDLASNQAGIFVFRGPKSIRMAVDEHTYVDSNRIHGRGFIGLPRGEIGYIRAVDVLDYAYNAKWEAAVRWVSDGTGQSKQPQIEIRSSIAEHSRSSQAGRAQNEMVRLNLQSGQLAIDDPTATTARKASREASLGD